MARDSSPGCPGGAQTLAHVLTRHRQGARRLEGKGVGADGSLELPFPQLPGLRTCFLGSRVQQVGRIPTVSFAWKFMQEKLGIETDSLHLFLKKPSSGPVKIFAKCPLECEV